MFKTNLLLFLVATSSLLNIASAQNPSQSQDLPQGNCAATEVQLKNGQCFPKGCAKQLAKLKTDSTTKKPGVKFTGTAKLTDSKDIEVTLEFPEDKATPILQKDSTGSCVEHALFNFGATLATEAADAATITTGYDETKSVRTVKFVILQSDFGTKVSKDIQTDKVIIKGLFAFKLLANQSNGNAKRILLVSLFGIRAVFNTDLKSLIGTINIAPRTIGDAACKADGTCIQTAKSEIKFCSDEACTTPVDTIALVQGQTFYVRQKVTESGFTTGFKVKKGELNISDGKGLSKTIKPNKEKNEDGSTTYEVKLNFITSNPVTIGATSELASGTTLRMLQETGDNAAVIGSVSAGCIKKDAAQTSCPTAAEVSAFNPKDCGDTSTTSCTGGSFGKLLLVGMVVLSFLM